MVIHNVVPREMMNRPIATVALFAALITPSFGQHEVGIPCESLTAYLKSAKPDEEQEAKARTIVDESQLIYAHYDHPEPSDKPAECSRFALSIKASYVVPIWHHAADGKTYPKIDLVFCKAYGESRSLSSAQWIEEMKRPLSKGYALASVRVVPTPTDEIRKKTTDIAAGIVRDFAAGLDALKADYPELQSFDYSTVRNHSLHFTHGLGPATKGGHTKLETDWCKIVFWIAPVTGNPRQQPILSKTYPLQATEACWKVESANPELMKKVTALVTTSLTRLDKYENQLSRKEDGTTTKSTLSTEAAPSAAPSER